MSTRPDHKNVFADGPKGIVDMFDPAAIDILESQTEQDIRRMLTKFGSKEWNQDTDDITKMKHGWIEGIPNSVFLRTSDNKVIHLNVGQDNMYALNVLAQNADKPTDAELSMLNKYVGMYRMMKGKSVEGAKFADFMGDVPPVKPEPQTVERKQAGFVERIRSLLHVQKP